MMLIGLRGKVQLSNQVALDHYLGNAQCKTHHRDGPPLLAFGLVLRLLYLRYNWKKNSDLGSDFT